MHLLHLRTKLEQGRTLNETGEQFSTLVCGRDGGRIRLRQLRRKNEHFGGCSDDDARPFLSKTEMGQIFSSFLWGYAIFQIPAGRIGDVVGPRLTLTVAALLWCVTSALTGLLPGRILSGSLAVLSSLFVLRFLLGAGEAATFPVGARAIRNWTPLSERGLGNSIMIAGASIAAAVTSPLVSWLMVRVGWRASFYITSVAALVLALVWRLTVTDHPRDHARISAFELKLITGDRTFEPRES